MGREKFKEELEALGYAVDLKDADRVIIDYRISEGKFAGQSIKVGFVVPQDYEMTPPGGIHISPRVIPINTQAPDHSRSADSPLGGEWQYLSRPFDQWALKRTGKRYMEYVAHLLNTL